MRTRIPWQLAKNSTIHLFLFNTLNNSVFIMIDNLFKEKDLNSPLAYLAKKYLNLVNTKSAEDRETEL